MTNGNTNTVVVSSFKKQLKVLLLLPFFTLLIGFSLVFFFLPFYIFRTILSFLVKWWDPQVSRVLTGLSASLLRDFESHQVKPLSTIVVCLKGRGELTFPEFREQFNKQIILRRDPLNKQALQFPELQQYYKNCMGYMFLKWDQNFNIADHIHLYENGKNNVIRRDEIMKIWQELMVKPFQKNKSPWEAILLQNAELDDGNGVCDKVIFLRIHHGIADGFSVQKLLTSLDDEFIPSTNIIPANYSKFQKVLINFRTAVFGPYDLLNKMVNCKEDYHSLHLQAKDLAKEYFVLESSFMQVENIKKAKREYGVAFTTILISIVCGGIRRYLDKTEKPFPNPHLLGIPFAIQGHSNKLENNFLIAPLTLPIHLPQARERIFDIQSQIAALYKSSISHMLGLSIDLLSFLPLKLMRTLTKKSVFSTAYSTLPGPTQPLGIKSGRLYEVNFTYGTGAASLGLCFSSITYLGRLRMTIFVDKNLVGSWDQAEQLIECLTEEYKNLCKGVLTRSNLRSHIRSS
ncbi:unnamed protein product [Orchesella dallaii]|uniref:O-acyltransferase WSD1 C-terminal domain-containing protein n=1 Tax=Orchesella dallaii TaxID=48710 RepID=A0ABP1RBD1_9HEXA